MMLGRIYSLNWEGFTSRRKSTRASVRNRSRTASWCSRSLTCWRRQPRRKMCAKRKNRKRFSYRKRWVETYERLYWKYNSLCPIGLKLWDVWLLWRPHVWLQIQMTVCYCCWFSLDGYYITVVVMLFLWYPVYCCRYGYQLAIPIAMATTWV